MPIAAAIGSRWKKKLSFGFRRRHHPSSSISKSAPPCSQSPSPSPSSVGIEIGEPPPPPPSPPPTPMSFICPISSSLMFDPVITPTGHTFERACIEACREVNFTPPSLSLISSLDFSSSSASFLLIPNTALRAAIIDWCDHFALPHPPPLSQDSARTLVRNLMLRTTTHPDSNFQAQSQNEEDCAHNNNKNKQQQPPSSSSSSSSSSCTSYSSISSFSSPDHIPQSAASTSSSSLVDVDPKIPESKSMADSPAPTNNNNNTVSEDSDPEAEAILIELKNPRISSKESGLVTLRHSARESSQRRISLCTPRLLSALVPMILSTNTTIQINATAAVVNLSIEPANKVKIVRSGAVPPLVEALRSTNSRSEEARHNAAGALFSLALEDENKLPIGVLGAIPPLVNLFCQAQQQKQSEGAGSAGHGVARVEAGMALYHLSLAPNNLSKIAKMSGTVKSILSMATTNADADAGDTAGGAVKREIEEEEGTIRLRLQRVAMMLLASLATRNEGRVALMDADAVKATVRMIREGGAAAGREQEYCLAVMYEMSKGSLRFRALARAAGAERVLLAMAGNGEGRGEVGKEMARRTLKVISRNEEKGVMLLLGDEYDYEEEEEEVGSVGSDRLSPFQSRYDDFVGGSGADFSQLLSSNSVI